MVIKPCTPAEVAFYESARASHPAFAAYMPTFMGTLTLASQQPVSTTQSSSSISESAAITSGSFAQVIGATAPPSTVVESPINAHPTDIQSDYVPTHGKRLDTNLAIALENVTYGFVRPNVLDVKLGTRLWDESAPLAKRARLDQSASETTSSSLGFRIAGMKVWRVTTTASIDSAAGEDGYEVFGKMYGRQFRAEDVNKGFKTFLSVSGGTEPRDELSRVTARRFAEEVKKIREILEAEESRMYGASILFVYEGDVVALQEALDEDRRRREEVDVNVNGQGREDDEDDDDDDEIEVDNDDEGEDGNKDEEGVKKRRRRRLKCYAVKLIDFAHATWTPGQGPDENVLKGVRNVQGIFESLGEEAIDQS